MKTAAEHACAQHAAVVGSHQMVAALVCGAAQMPDVVAAAVVAAPGALCSYVAHPSCLDAVPDFGELQDACTTAAPPAAVTSPAAATACWVATAGLSTHAAAAVVTPIMVIGLLLLCCWQR